MALNTPGLNRWQQMQAKPIGNLATSMAAPSAAQTDYKQRVQDYSRAMRALRQESRRAPTRMGRAQAAMARIRLGERAVESGVQGVQGIRRSEDQNTAALGYEQSLGQAATAQERANVLGMGSLQGASGAQGATGVQGASGVRGATGLQGAPRNPDADGNGVPDMIQRPTEGIGASQQPRLGYKPEASMRSYDDSKIDLGGEIVETARGPLAQARRGLAQRIESGSITGDELKKEQRRLGISNTALNRFLNRT